MRNSIRKTTLGLAALALAANPVGTRSESYMTPPPQYGDYDADDDIDLYDAAAFQRCYRGPNVEVPSECLIFDARTDAGSPDGDVDLEDYIKFANRLTGPVANSPDF